MKNQTIKQNMILLLTIPLLGLVFFSASSALNKVGVVNEMEKVGELATLAVQMSELVHEAQKERGLTAGYLGTKGAKFGSELRSQTSQTDAAMEKLDQTLSSTDLEKFDLAFREKTRAGLAQLKQLTGIRANVLDQDIQPAQAIGFYTKTNADFLGAITSISHETNIGSVVAEAIAYSSFLEGKERAGIERAVLTSAFGNDAFAPGEYAKFVSLVTKQNTYFDVFRTLASSEQVANFEATVSGPAVDATRRMRTLVNENYSTGGFGVSSENWFSQQTKKINLLKMVESRLSADFIEHVEVISTRAKRASIMAFGMLGIMALGSIIAGFFIIRSINEKLSNITNRLSHNAQSAAASATQLSATSESIASGASEQAASMEETSATLEELSSMSDQNLDNTRQANKISSEVMNSVSKSREAMGRMAGAIDSIKESSDETSKIIKTIDEIAFQTNLLALNAAVEAARAGDAGRGFAVVAEEVRNLAKRCSEAAGNTSVLLEESNLNATNGVTMTQEVSTSLGEVITGVNEVSEIMDTVTTSFEEQVRGIQEINTAVNQMDQVTQANAASSEESSSASEELSSQAGELQLMVGELAQLVSGQKSRHSAGSVHHQGAKHPAHTTSRMAGFNPNSVSLVPPKPQTIADDVVIPLEEDEFLEI